jgi:hypothetical protein
MVRRNRVILALILFLLAFVMVSPGAAHPPSSIDLRFEPAGSLLVVGFRHVVQDGQTHYVKEIKIQINGKEFAKIDLYAQAGKDGGQLSVALPEVKSGDLVNVKAECNKFGELKKDLRIP